MSLEAILWVKDHAPVNKHGHLALLYSLANYADKNGRGAFPAQSTLAAEARCTRRTVQRWLTELEELGVIRRGDQHLVDHYRKDRRPIVWDICLTPSERGDNLTLRNDNGATEQAERGDRALSHNPSINLNINPPIPPLTRKPLGFAEFRQQKEFQHLRKREAVTAYKQYTKEFHQNAIIDDLRAGRPQPPPPRDQLRKMIEKYGSPNLVWWNEQEVRNA